MHGSPRFVLGVYDSGGSYSTDPAQWESQIFAPTGPRGLQGTSLNVYLNYHLGGMPIGPTNALLDVLNNHGMMYLQTGNCFAAGSWTRYGATAFSISSQAYVQQFAQHPAALGYYIMDECEDSLVSETQQHHQQLKGWDPNGVSFVASVAVSYRDPAIWVNAGDVQGIDPYPMYGAEPAQGYPHWIIADYTAELRSVARPDRPIWTVLQFFKFTSNSRMPTAGELRAHAVMSIVEGAQGLFWWEIGSNGLQQLDPTTRSASMANLRDLTTELARLEPALLADPADAALVGNSTRFSNPVAGRIAQLQRNIANDILFSRVQGYQAEIAALQSGNTSQSPMLAGAANVRTRTKIVNGVGYVFAYNYTNLQQPVTFTWQSPIGSVRESKTGQSYPVSGASWNDTFGPYEARIYIIDGGSGAPPPPTPPPSTPPPSTPPAPGALTVSFTNPGSGASVAGNATVTMNATGGTGYTFRLAVDGVTAYTGTNPSFTWNTTTVGNGPHTLIATVTDASGRSGTSSLPVTVANGSPSTPSPSAPFAVSFLYPSGGSRVSGSQSVGMSTTANWGRPKTFTLSVDGAVITSQSFPTATTFWHTWDTTIVPDGGKTLTVAVTMDGQTATASMPVNVLNASPAPTVDLGVNTTAFQPGDSLLVTRTMGNSGSQALVDVYFGISVPASLGPQLGCPQGDAVVFVDQSGMAVRCASAPASTFPRFAASSVVPALLPPTVADFFGLVWPQAPPGVYTLFMALTAPDSLAAGAPLAGNVLALSLANVTLGQ